MYDLKKKLSQFKKEKKILPKIFFNKKWKAYFKEDIRVFRIFK